MRILGIDPGSVICGYGVIDVDGNTMSLVEYGVIEAKKKQASFPFRLQDIHHRLCGVIERSQPDACAMEQVFYAKNVASVVKLSHARGVAILACAQGGMEPFEYTPMQVKRAVTGNGRSAKEQVGFMVRTMLKIKETPQFFDATDALAVAICHALNGGAPPPLRRRTAKRSTWAAFVDKNPDRLVR
jgi:crossover junction endodeoxyribonuclease RuvC